MDFNQWLIRRGNVKRSTVLHYAGAVYGTISRLVGRPIYEINDIKEFDKLYKEIIESPEFVKLNKDGNRMYSSALKKFRAFLYESESLVPFISSDIEEINSDDSLDNTVKLRLVSARVGQGKYREGLDKSIFARSASYEALHSPK